MLSQQGYCLVQSLRSQVVKLRWNHLLFSYQVAQASASRATELSVFLLNNLPQDLGSGRHIQMANAKRLQGVDNRAQHSRSRADRSRLADALDSQGVHR